MAARLTTPTPNPTAPKTVSAYFCSDSVFHLIATYAATVKASNQLETVWRQLIQENLKSLNHRYPAHQTDNVKTAANALRVITDRPMLPLPDPAVIKSALTEYRYQSCEHPAYTTSAAGQLVAQLLATIEQPAAVSQDGGGFDTDALETPQPAPVTPTPGGDPIEAARASLLAAFNAPAAPEPIAPEPEPEPTPKPAPDRFAMWHDEAKTRALALLLTLQRVSDGDPNSIKFGQLAERIGATMEQQAKAEASKEAARNAAALRSALDCAA
jgi:hypothetical protein